MRTNLRERTILSAGALGVGLVLGPVPAWAQSANSDYETRLGDTCGAIAERAYGDRRRVDLIHKGNPSLGALPHNLKPGTVLHLPALEKAAAAPDARVTFVRNKVTVQAQATKPAAVNDLLFRSNRVSTADASSANVTFRDETQLRVGEESLVIILGDVQGAARRQAADATLVSGNLQARLGELSGKRPLTVDTQGGARVTMAKGSALVGVDAAKTTRVAVHAGSATLSASQRAVAVPSGFGSKAEEGKPPTPPRPLPAPPAWQTPPHEVLFTGPDDLAEVTATFGEGRAREGVAAPVAAYRVQLARDAKLDDLVTDVIVPKTSTTIDARRLPPGAYYVRVAALDDDKFEGPPGPVAMFVVVKATVTAASLGRADLGVSPGDLVTCTADGAARLADVDATLPHTLSCGLDPRRAGTYARGIDVPTAPGLARLPELVHAFTVSATLREAHPEQGRGVVALELRDRSGAALPSEGLTATASNGVEVTGVTHEAGVALVAVRFATTPRPFFVTALRGGARAQSNVLRTPSPEAAPRRADGSRGVPDRGYEISFGAGVGSLFTGHGGRQLALGTAYRAPLAPRVNVAVGPTVTLARFEPQLASATSYSPAPLGATSDHFDVLIGVPVSLRVFPHALVSPYLSAGPELAFQRSTFATGTARASSSGVLLGGRFALGAQAEIGPGWVFLEGGVRAAAIVAKDPAAERLSGATLDLGYRVGW